MDPLEQYTRLRCQELEAQAAAHRRARQLLAAERRRPSRALRLYARLWWASRPRAAAWAPTLFESASP
jgi:hypothetical protein